MTKTRIWLMILTAFVVSVVIVSGSMASAVTRPVLPDEAAQEETSVSTEAGFILKTWNGHLGLFRGDCETPYREIDMPLYLLAEDDVKLLESGIVADSEEELRRLVEDITS